MCIWYDVGIQLVYITAMILSNYCIYPVDVKAIVCMHIVMYFLGQGSKVDQFVPDWLYTV